MSTAVKMDIQPCPPIEKWNIVKVYDTDFRPELIEMYKTITNLELWGWMKNENPPSNQGYMFWGHPNVDRISNGLSNNPHSGATFGYCMRCMQSIAKNGFDKWNDANCRKDEST